MSEQLKITKPVRLIELFAGIGSTAQALTNLGIEYEHHDLCEIDPVAVKIYNVIHKTHFLPSDIKRRQGRGFHLDDYDDFTYILSYTPPCQDISIAGKKKGMRRGSKTRSSLIFELDRLLTTMNPKPHILVMENVASILNPSNKPDLDEWIDCLSSYGYTSKYKVLNADDYGIPQHRRRLEVIIKLIEN